MPKEWAKVCRDVKDSERMETLLATNPFAEAIFWRLKAAADDFGRFPADPVTVGNATCPRNLIARSTSLPKIVKALQSMEDCRVIHRYVAADGRQYLEICDYLNHAHEKWANVGKAEYPAPPGWQPPPDLVQFLVENAGARNVTAARYGVSIECWPPGIEYPFNTHSEGTERVLNTPPIDVDVDSDKRLRQETETKTRAPAPEDTCHSALAQAAFHFWKDGRAPGGNDNWQQQLLSAYRTEQKQPNPVTEAELLDAFEKHPPLPSEWPDKWVARVHTILRGFSDKQKKGQRLGNAPMTRAEAAAEAKRLEEARSA